MRKPHIKFTTPQILSLYTQVNGLCPLCGKNLSYTKKKNIQNGFEIAHIYPLNPSLFEEDELKNETKLSDNSNSLSNLIPLCFDCHHKYDHPRTAEEYRELSAIKQKLEIKKNIQEEYYSCSIEKELVEIIEALSQQSDYGSLLELDYCALKIDQKIKKDTDKILKHNIRLSVLEYYHYIKKLFVDIDKIQTGKFDIMSSQIRTAYLKFNSLSSDQNVVFHSMVDWLQTKTKQKSTDACGAIISFFVQSCEVFENVSK